MSQEQLMQEHTKNEAWIQLVKEEVAEEVDNINNPTPFIIPAMKSSF